MKFTVRLLFAAICSLGLLLVMSGTIAAQTISRNAPAIPAHASVIKAIPAIGSTIPQAPTSVTVFTAENINPDPKVSNLFVYGPSGEATAALISLGNAQVSLTNPEEMSVKIKPDPQHLNGVYVVRWITKSALDGDPDEGAFTFTVNTSAAGTTGTPTPVATATGHGTAPATTSSGGTPVWVDALLAIAGLGVGLGAGVAVGRRGRAAPAASLGAMRRSIADEQKETTKRP